MDFTRKEDGGIIREINDEGENQRMKDESRRPALSLSKG